MPNKLAHCGTCFCKFECLPGGLEFGRLFIFIFICFHFLTGTCGGRHEVTRVLLIHAKYFNMSGAVEIAPASLLAYKYHIDCKLPPGISPASL